MASTTDDTDAEFYAVFAMLCAERQPLDAKLDVATTALLRHAARLMVSDNPRDVKDLTELMKLLPAPLRRVSAELSLDEITDPAKAWDLTRLDNRDIEELDRISALATGRAQYIPSERRAALALARTISRWRSVFRALSLCACCRHYPGAATGRTTSLTAPSHISLSRKGRRVGLRIVLFEVCSAFTRVRACTLALSPIRDTHSEGFSHFVASMTAPVASGWTGCRVGLAPTGKRRLITAHTRSGH
jgi:hypothetical protein